MARAHKMARGGHALQYIGGAGPLLGCPWRIVGADGYGSTGVVVKQARMLVGCWFNWNWIPIAIVGHWIRLRR